jgi:putative ABC transport system permease protein
MLQGVIVDRSTFSAVSSSKDPFAWFVRLTPGTPAASVEPALQTAVKPFPPATVDTVAQYKQTVASRLDQIVYLLYALLAMSLVISLFGIANSLLLSIHERTREFGLLRAVGATRTQIRRIVRYESVITAVIGGLLGTIVGIAFAGLVTVALADLGLVFSLPVTQLVVFLMLAVIVGMLGAAGPARRGARVAGLDALPHPARASTC